MAGFLVLVRCPENVVNVFVFIGIIRGYVDADAEVGFKHEISNDWQISICQIGKVSGKGWLFTGPGQVQKSRANSLRAKIRKDFGEIEEQFKISFSLEELEVDSKIVNSSAVCSGSGGGQRFTSPPPVGRRELGRQTPPRRR